MTFSMKGEDLAGFRNSKACAAVSSSMDRMRSKFFTTLKHLVAAFAPMLTWSSCPLEEGMESTEAGVQSCLFCETMLAAVYCGIMNPEFKPGLAAKNAGNSLCPEIKR